MKITSVLVAATLVFLMAPIAAFAKESAPAPYQDLFQSISDFGGQLAATALSILGDKTKVQVLVGGSHGPVAVKEGQTFSIRWMPMNILHRRDFTSCSLTYPGGKGKTTMDVSSWGQQRIALSPLYANYNSVDFSCTREGKTVSDNVQIKVVDKTSGGIKKTSPDTASPSGVGGSSGGSGRGNYGGGSGSGGYNTGGFYYLPVGNTGSGTYVPFGTPTSPDDSAAQEMQKTQSQ